MEQRRGFDSKSESHTPASGMGTMSAESVRFPESDVVGADKNHRANDTNGARSEAPPRRDFELSPALRMRESSLSPRPFLLSSRRAWIVLDFVLALSGCDLYADALRG